VTAEGRVDDAEVQRLVRAQDGPVGTEHPHVPPTALGRAPTFAQVEIVVAFGRAGERGNVSRVARDTSSWEQLSLRTERLCLRTPTPQDAEALHEVFADEEVMQGLGREPVPAVEDVRAMIEGMIEGWRTEGLGPFILETAATEQRVVGQAGLMIYDTRGWTPSSWAKAGNHAQPELGWALIRAHRGHGYATEAAAAIRDWAYESRAVGRLVSLISPNNIRSQRVAERLGAIAAEAVTPADSGRPAVVWKHLPPSCPASRR
jgi:RimJ/RimL family protein N-acetyltransferase